MATHEDRRGLLEHLRGRGGRDPGHPRQEPREQLKLREASAEEVGKGGFEPGVGVAWYTCLSKIKRPVVFTTLHVCPEHHGY